MKPKRIHQRSERGQAAIEMAIVLPFLAIVLIGVLMLGPWLIAQMAITIAANDCATAASQTLSAEQGRFQGISAANSTLAAYRLRNTADIVIAGTWERGSPVICTIGYTVAGVDGLARVISLDPRIVYSVALPAQAFKSVWR